MPIIRKIILLGNSKVVTIPKSWLEYYEKQQGRPIKSVAIEVDNVLKISPYLEETIPNEQSQKLSSRYT